jgi:hypothetical protein
MKAAWVSERVGWAGNFSQGMVFLQADLYRHA